MKLRCCNHKLEIEAGRYAGIDRDLRYCGKYAMNIIGDKHVFFECSNPNASLERISFIPLYLKKIHKNHSMFNFVKLLQSVHDIKVGRRCIVFCNELKYCVRSICE